MIKISETSLQIKIAQATISDTLDLVSCINTGILHPPYWTAPELKWWFFRYPFPVVIYHAIYKKETIGTFAVFKRRLTNNLTCGILMGLVIKKEWRNKGLFSGLIFSSLGKKALEHFKDIDLFIAFTNNTGVKALERNFGFKTMVPIETLLLKKNDSKKIQKPHVIEKINSKTTFKNFKPEKKHAMFKNDTAFRKWRYAQNPLFSYYKVTNQSKNFSIVKIFTDKESGNKVGDIVDFEILEINKKNIRDLFTTSCSALFSLGADAVTLKALPGNIICNLAFEMGFVDSGKSHYFCIKNRTNLSSLNEPQNWIVRWGDFMRR